jgi:uncharacterized membrane protein
MRGISLGVAVLALMAGLYFTVNSLTVRAMTGEHSALLGCAFFLFVIALGVWAEGKTQHERDLEAMMQELIRRQAPPTQNPPSAPMNPHDSFKPPR